MRTKIEKLHSSQLLLGFIGLIACMFFAVTPIFAFSEEATEGIDEHAVTDTIANSGTTLVHKDDTYYIKEDGILVRNQDSHILYEESLTSFLIYEDTIYAAREEKGNTEIVTLTLNGEKIITAYTIKGQITSFSLKNNYLFYLKEGTLFKENGDIIKTDQGITSFALAHENKVNYANHLGYYQYDLDTKKTILLSGITEDKSNRDDGGFQLKATLFSPRLAAPVSPNSYYFSNSNIFYASGYGMPNCTAYAYGRAYEILGKTPRLCPNNAGKWYDYNVNNSCYPYGSTPKLGAIAVWANDSSRNQGHVAVVEKINSNGSITISESHYKSTFFTTKTAHINSLYTSKKFLGFIYILNDGVASNVTATPTLSAADTQNGKTITLSCETPGATIYYTTNGATPTTASKKYTGPFTINTDTTIKAIAVKSGYTNSGIMSKSINISSVSAPVANVASGSTVATNSKVYLSTATPGATIYYTTNGSTPTTASNKYSGGVTISQSLTLKAIAVKQGLLSSTVSTFQYTNWTSPFTDVKGGEWYFGDITEAYDNNYISGVTATTFNPSGKTNRAMFVSILSRLDSTHDLSNYQSDFSDVPGNQWYSYPVGWAEANGIVNGVGDNLFAPTANITREQASVIIVNYAKAFNITLDSSEMPTMVFKDAAKISDYAKDAVKLTQQAGIISGRTDGNFDPKGYATRAEITSIIMRMVRLYL